MQWELCGEWIGVKCRHARVVGGGGNIDSCRISYFARTASAKSYSI